MDETSDELKGHCHCGAITYRVAGAPKFSFLCHCDDCRRLNGGARLAGISFDREALTIEGEPSSYRYPGGKADIDVSFCGRCGTPLFAYPHAYEGVVVVRSNSLAEPGSIAPRKSIFFEKACGWDHSL